MEKDRSEKSIEVNKEPQGKHIAAIKGGIEIRQDKHITTSKGALEIRHRGKPINVEMPGTGSVYLAVDCSGSMEGQKLQQAKRGAIDFAKEARKKGYATGLICFDTEAVHLCDPQQDVSALQRQLEPVAVGGSTNMTHAIQLAMEKLRSRQGIRVLVVVTDGMPDKPQRALGAADRAKKEGIDIIAVGTDDADQEFLERLASRSGLATVVQREQLSAGIVSTAQMLPRGE